MLGGSFSEKRAEPMSFTCPASHQENLYSGRTGSAGSSDQAVTRAGKAHQLIPKSSTGDPSVDARRAPCPESTRRMQNIRFPLLNRHASQTLTDDRKIVCLSFCRVQRRAARLRCVSSRSLLGFTLAIISHRNALCRRCTVLHNNIFT